MRTSVFTAEVLIKIIGGALAIAAAFILFYIGTWGVERIFYYIKTGLEGLPLYIFIAPMAFLGFAYGLKGGVSFLKKEKSNAVMGVWVMIAVGLVTVAISSLHPALLYGAPVLVLSAPSLFCAYMLPAPQARPKEVKPAPSAPAGLVCPYCRAELPADSVFCTECGRKFKRAERTK